jgi:hypothetical protein
MKAFISGMVLLVAISVVAWLALDSFAEPSADAYKIQENVRL